MSFFSDERSSELKELFFESATELVQTLNEEGLVLEKRPGDAEVVRQVRRTVHTLKGDSAACGFQELSELAHELEDVLTPELAQQQNGRVAEVVLGAADTFQTMLAAYRSNTAPPMAEELRRAIGELKTKPANGKPETSHLNGKAATRFEWTEYEQMVISDAGSRGLKVVQLSMAIDPGCAVRAAALQMVRNAVQELGTLLVISPDDAVPAADIQSIAVALASSFDLEYIARKCKIPSVISDIVVERFAAATTQDNGAGESDLLGIMSGTDGQQAHFATEDSLDEPSAGKHSGKDSHPMNTAPAESTTSAISTAPENILRVDAEKIDSLLNLVGELIIGKSMLMQTVGDFEKRHAKDPLRAKFADAMAFQARVLNDLQKSVMKVRMVPVEQLFRRFPRMVRDIAKACEKEVELVVSGADTDLDKTILDVMAEPMAHLVRNAIGHGIESPEEREAMGKPRHGVLRLDAYHQGNFVVIEVADDGRGIDRQMVAAKAIEHGVIASDEAARMTEGEILNLIFHPGFSTADEVTAISGRGVGMDVVRTVLERLKGTVEIETKVGQGSTFYLKVPLTLAIIQALMFRAGDRQYAVPLNSVVEITRAYEHEVHRVDQHEVLRVRDEVLTLVRLGRLTHGKPSKAKKLFVVIIAIGDRKFGLVVDKLVGEEELVIKALDDHLVATDLVSGASILGDGNVVLILNVQAVISRLGKADNAAREIGATA